MEFLTYVPKEAIPASLPETRANTQELIKNLDPTALPTELDLNISAVYLSKLNHINKF